MDYRKILQEINSEVQPLFGKGVVADYIPALKRVAPSQFGMAVSLLNGEEYLIGDCNESFSIQSISKVYSLVLAFAYKRDCLWRRVGREPSGNPFNSLVQLEYEKGIPRNPFINAGALVVADIVLNCFDNPRKALIDFIREVTGNPYLDFDPVIAESEKSVGYTNAALANYLKSHGNLEGDVDEVLDFYFSQCSIKMTVGDLARSFRFLANHGVIPESGRRFLTSSQSKRLNALMLTCGCYDEAGEFAFRVGIPGKSGVGGGIVGLIPDFLSVAVWSPELNLHGNSLVGMKALELFTTKTELSVF